MKRVAVVAVHGVADQRPGETGLAIAALLANLQANDDAPAYGAFTEETILVPVRKLPVPDSGGLEQTTFANRAASLRSLERWTDTPVDVGIEFMSTLLAGYEPSGPDEAYETTRRRSTRRAVPAGSAAPERPAVEVDVFECYWADLSRLSESALRIFAEIYQLLFHLASLGVHAIRAAQVKETDNASSRTWERWGRAQAQAANALSLGMMLPNLFLAGLVVILALASLPLVSGLDPALVGLTSLLIVGAAVAWVVSLYEVHRPGAGRWALGMGGPIVAVFVTSLWWPRTAEAPLQRAVLRAGEVTYLMMAVAWIWLVVSGWVSFFCGRAVTASTGANRGVLGRVRWTARLTLALPAVMFTALTILLWTAVWTVLRPRLGAVVDATHGSFLLGRLFGFGDVSVHAFVDELIDHAAGAGFGLMMLLVVVAAVITLVAVLPAAIEEVRPPAEGVDGAWTGRWLDGGLRYMRWAGHCLVLGVMVVVPLGVLLLVISEAGLLNPVTLLGFWETTRWVFRAASYVLAPVAVGLFAFRDRLKTLTLRLRGFVDVLLDVDNYLREHPRRRTPRARICARYASLLRHVLAGGYDAIVVVAHSQGTVISTDLLRYITAQERSTPGYLSAAGLGGLAHADVRLFTMGCPLRQLYGLRFPHFYAWARHDVPGPWTDPVEPILATTGPDPAALGLSQWVNAYRSADYVGRQLWRPDACDFQFRSVPARPSQPWAIGPFPRTASETAPPLANRREFCIGAGAHTHYWDRTAPQIALELDALISG